MDAFREAYKVGLKCLEWGLLLLWPLSPGLTVDSGAMQQVGENGQHVGHATGCANGVHSEFLGGP